MSLNKISKIKIKGMKQNFSVKSNDFNRYKQFKEIIESFGGRYNSDFNKFEDGLGSCLYFSHKWRGGDSFPNGFSFSNSSREINIDTLDGFIEALKAFNDFRVEMSTVTKREIAKWRGVDIDKLLIVD